MKTNCYKSSKHLLKQLREMNQKSNLLQLINGFALIEKKLCYKSSKNLHHKKKKTQKSGKKTALAAPLPAYRMRRVRAADDADGR